MGGDWVVAQAVTNRIFRDHIRSQLGPDLIFVVLNMTKENQTERLKERHGEDSSFTETLLNMYDLYEPGAEDEPNTVNINVTSTMSRDDVANNILEVLPK